MKITPLTIDFDVTNAQEVEFVNDLMNRLFGSAPLKAMAAPTESPVNSTSVPTFSEPTQTAAPVQEFKKEANPEATAIDIAEETITEAIAEVKKELRKPVTVGKPGKVAKPKTVKEAPQATIEPEPVQAPTEEEKAPERASNEPLTAKDMQAFMIDLMKSGKITRPQLTDIMLEFGGASLMRIKPEKFELLKQRIETYND
jgi:cytoskeletal protein RodZ